jgi:ribosomal protein S18 acetylase RimI-like enzyme
MLTLRPFQPEDTATVIALWRHCGLVHVNNDPGKDIIRKSKVRPDLFIVGLSEGAIVASVMVGYEGHRGWINYLAVSPDHQRKGYGRVLMEEAERLLRKEGCPKINLQVRTTNAAVLAFYETIGYGRDEVTSLGKRLEHDNLPQSI